MEANSGTLLLLPYVKLSISRNQTETPCYSARIPIGRGTANILSAWTLGSKNRPTTLANVINDLKDDNKSSIVYVVYEMWHARAPGTRDSVELKVWETERKTENDQQGHHCWIRLRQRPTVAIFLGTGPGTSNSQGATIIQCLQKGHSPAQVGQEDLARIRWLVFTGALDVLSIENS